MADENQEPRTKVGRKKQWYENVNLRLREGKKAQIDALLHEGEDRLDFIRTSIDKEIELREIEARSEKSSST